MFPPRDRKRKILTADEKWRHMFELGGPDYENLDKQPKKQEEGKMEKHYRVSEKDQRKGLRGHSILDDGCDLHYKDEKNIADELGDYIKKHKEKKRKENWLWFKEVVLPTILVGIILCLGMYFFSFGKKITEAHGLIFTLIVGITFFIGAFLSVRFFKKHPKSN
jgi:hypothetical protein